MSRSCQGDTASTRALLKKRGKKKSPDFRGTLLISPLMRRISLGAPEIGPITNLASRTDFKLPNHRFFIRQANLGRTTSHTI